VPGLDPHKIARRHPQMDESILKVIYIHHADQGGLQAHCGECATPARDCASAGQLLNHVSHVFWRLHCTAKTNQSVIIDQDAWPSSRLQYAIRLAGPVIAKTLRRAHEVACTTACNFLQLSAFASFTQLLCLGLVAHYAAACTRQPSARRNLRKRK